MTLQEIENLSYDELKANRETVLADVKNSKFAEVAERYLQARIDAKQRDEKLAEQGKTITLLQAGHDQLTDALNAKTELLSAAHGAIDQGRQKQAELTAEIERLRGLLRAETDKSARLQSCAVKHQNALTGALKLLSDAVAMNEIEKAAEGS